MVALSTTKSTNEARAKRKLTAVFFGGTAGIGSYTLQSLAVTYGTSGSGLRCYIVGRNAQAAETLIAGCQASNPSGVFRFVQADLSLFKSVDGCCEQIIEAEKAAAATGEEGVRIDLVMMSQGVLQIGRRETAEGLDISMSLLYYSRIRIIQNLAPFSRTINTTSFISVYAAGAENRGHLYPYDLDLREPGHYSFSSCRTNVIHMKTMMFEHFAKQYEGRISLVHVWPGIVVTEAFGAVSNPWWFRVAWAILGPFFKRFFSVPQDEIGPKLLFLISPRFPARGAKDKTEHEGDSVVESTDGVPGGGAYSTTHKGETCNVSAFYAKLRTSSFGDDVLKHTTGTFEDIVKDGSSKR